MERLPQRHLRGLLKFLEGLAAVSERDAFIAYLLTELPTLIRSEILTYNEMVPSQQISQDWVTTPEFNTPEQSAVWARHMHEHPTLMHQLRTGDGRAWTISDFLTRAQLHRLALYNELYRVWHVEDVLTTAIAVSGTPTTVIGVGWYRDRRTFSEHDRALLNLLRPHLAQTHARVTAQTRVQEALSCTQQVLEALEQGIIILSRDGSIRDITPQAGALLRTYWGPAAQGAGKLPAGLQDWVNHQRGPALLLEPDGPPAPPDPLVLEREQRLLVVRLVKLGLEDDLLILEEQQTVPSPSAFRSLGLTDRESEVLLWVSQGKTDAEVATILGASPKTVGKHLERIYQKLGVETRTAAAIRALTSPAAR